MGYFGAANTRWIGPGDAEKKKLVTVSFPFYPLIIILDTVLKIDSQVNLHT